MSEKKITRKKTTAAEVKTSASGIRALTAQDLALDASQKKEMSVQGFSTSVRVLLQNWRQGTVAVKGRSDVAFSNKKPWRQKGTGRARAGSARSPLWRKGGVCFGPQPRTRTLRTSKNLKRGVMNSLLWNYLEKGKIICIDRAIDKPKTALAYGAIKDAGLVGKRVNVFVQYNDQAARASFANITNVKTLFFDQANAYDLANAQTWVVLSKDLPAFKDMVSAWHSN